MKTNWFQSSLILQLTFLILVCVISRAPIVSSGCTPTNLKAEESPSSKRPDDIRIHLSWSWSCQEKNDIEKQLDFSAQYLNILDNKSYTGIYTVKNGCDDWKSSCEWTVTNNVISQMFREETKFMPCSSYSFRLEDSIAVSLWIKPGEENMRPQLNVSVERDAANIKNMLMSIGLRQSMHPFCAHLLKEIQVSLNNSNSKSSPFILPCLYGAQLCSASVQISQFNFCQSYFVQLRLVYNYGRESELFHSSTTAITEDTSYQDVVVVESNNPEALAIHWKDPCFLVPDGEWKIAMQRLTITTVTADGQNDDWKHVNSMMFHEILPAICFKDQYQEGKNSIELSLVLYKDQPFLCRPANLIPRILHYDSCGSYSMELEHSITGSSFDPKVVALVTNFTTSLDYSDVWDVGARNITSNSYELHWSIPARCRTLDTMNITINGVSHVLQMKNLNEDCDAKKCRISWKSESLTPCTRYSIKVGERSINITTYPSDAGDSTPSLSISANRNGNQNNLELNVEVFKTIPGCAALVDSVQVVFTNRTASLMEASQLLKCETSLLNEKLSCKGKHIFDQLNLCQAHQVEVRFIYSDSLFSDKTQSILANLTPSTYSPDYQEFTFIRVEQLDSQTFTLEWNNNCLTGHITYWNILIRSPDHKSGNVSLLHIPYSCSRDFTIDDVTKNNISSSHRGHRVVLSHGQVTCSSPFKNTYGKVFNLLPCSSYTIQVTPINNINILTEFSQEINFTTIYHREGEETLRSPLTVSAARSGNGDLTMSIIYQLTWKVHPRCALLLKEIQVLHNASRSSPYALPCSNDVNNQSGCSASFFFPQFDLCRSHSVQLRLIFNNGQQSELLNSTLDKSAVHNTSALKIVALTTINPETLTIRWEDSCSLTQAGEWKISIKPLATDASSENHHRIEDSSTPLSDGNANIFNETLPSSCVIDQSQDEANINRFFRYSMTLYKDKFFQCPSNNYTTATFHYDPCTSYSIELEQKASASYHPKISLWTIFSTPLDSSAVNNLTVANLTFTSFEMSWLISSQCSDSTQKGVKINGEIHPIHLSDIAEFQVDRKWKLVRWRNPKVLSPCKTYRVQVGSSVMNISTPIDFVTGSVNNLTVEIMNLTSIDIRWDPPTCERRINYWRLTLWSDYDKITSTLVNVTLPSKILFYTIAINIGEKIGMMENDSSLLAILEPCKIYYVNVVTEWADGGSYEVEEIVPIECPPSIMTFWADGVGLGVIILLSSLGFMIVTTVVVGVYYFQIRLRRRKREEADHSSDFRVVELNTYDFIPTSSSSF